MASHLNDDVMLMIYDTISDLSTLNNAVSALPNLYLEGNKIQLIGTIEKIFRETWPEAMRRYAHAILLAQRETPTKPQELRDLLHNLSDGQAHQELAAKLPCPLETLQNLSNLTDSVDFFFNFCVTKYLQRLPQRKRYPLSKGEKDRLWSALLRFQLYTQLFHQSEATDEIVSDRDWEQRPRFQHYFWTRFQSVEAEECKCIYMLLCFSLENMLESYSTSELADYQDRNRFCKANETCYEKSTQRGLPLLYQVFSEPSYSLLAASYASRLLDYAFTGFNEVDPHDANFFIPYSSIQYPSQNGGLRLIPRDRACREENFGFKIPRKPQKITDPVEKAPDRTELRLIGYCFWDDERIDFDVKELISS